MRVCGINTWSSLMKNYYLIVMSFIVIFQLSACNGGNEVNTNSDTTQEVVELTYNEKAQYLNLYSGCISCHDNERRLNFNSVNDAISSVNNVFGDQNIDEAGGEDAIVDEAINALVDLYHSRSDGAPFSYVGVSPTRRNMSNEVNHSPSDKINIDKLNAWIKKEHNL